MAMPLGMAMYLMRMVWFSLSGWVFTCVAIADEIAGSLRNGDIGPFHAFLNSGRAFTAVNAQSTQVRFYHIFCWYAGKVLNYETF
ncbi:hypothetical protein AtEden1_Chr3g0214021 [Arabidopsis thaliana]